MTFAHTEKGEMMSRFIDAEQLWKYADNQKDKSISANDFMRFPYIDLVRCALPILVDAFAEDGIHELPRFGRVHLREVVSPDADDAHFEVAHLAELHVLVYAVEVGLIVDGAFTAAECQ